MVPPLLSARSRRKPMIHMALRWSDAGINLAREVFAPSPELTRKWFDPNTEATRASALTWKSAAGADTLDGGSPRQALRRD
jgi:hypothetical protein